MGSASDAGSKASAAPRVVIAGGGVIGVCCAYYLARRGARVVVLERGELARGASYGNAGSISPGHPPINKPGRVKQALKSLFDPLSPLYVAPRLDPELFAWFWKFARRCTREHLEYSMGVLAPLGHATRRLFDELVAEEKLDCDYRRNGYFEVYATEAGLAAGRHEAELVRRYGFHPEALTGEELRERDPSFSRRILGAIYYPEAASVNPYRFVLEMAERARRLGVEFRSGVEVAAVAVEGGRARGLALADSGAVEADAVVLATGAYTVPLVRKLGLRLPLQPAKGYHRDRRPTPGKTPDLRYPCILGEKSVFCTPMDGFVRFAGTLEFSGVNDRILRPRLEQLTNAAKQYFEAMGEDESLSEWCGLRPCLPDGLPAIGPVRRFPGLYVATGHAMLGLTLSPVTGKLIAECILDGAPSLEISGLDPERF